MPFKMTLLFGQPCLFFLQPPGYMLACNDNFSQFSQFLIIFLIEYILVGYGSKTSDLFGKSKENPLEPHT